MHFLKSTLSFVKFRVDGNISFSESDLQKKLELHAFSDLSEMPNSQRSCGWVSYKNCLHTPDISQETFSPYLLLAFRVDTRKISPDILKAHLEIEEKAALAAEGKQRLSLNRKRELKRQVENILLMRAKTQTKVCRVLLDLSSKTCLLLETNQKLRSDLMTLFKDTFDAELRPYHYDILLDVFPDQCAFENMKNFFSWIWFYGEENRWEVASGDFIVYFGITDYLEMQGDDEKLRINSPVPTKKEAAKIALEKMLPSKMTMVLIKDTSEYNFTLSLQGTHFIISSLRLVTATTSHDLDRFSELSEDLEHFHEVFASLFNCFIREIAKPETSSRMDHWKKCIEEDKLCLSK